MCVCMYEFNFFTTNREIKAAEVEAKAKAEAEAKTKTEAKAKAVHDSWFPTEAEIAEDTYEKMAQVGFCLRFYT